MAPSPQILIVDDDGSTRDLLQVLMHRSGYETVTAENGEAAIARLREADFALVILDLMMPEVSGRDVIDFLVSSGLETPVVVCTAAGAASSGTFDEARVRAVVRKPFDIDELVGTVERLVNAPDAGSR